MSDTAARQLERLVRLVAELSRGTGARGHGGTIHGVALGELARHFGVGVEQIERDIRTLTHASDAPDAEWLSSLGVWQEGDRVSVTSRGPFRRPLRFTPDEVLAIQVGLAMEGGEAAAALSRRLGELLLGADAPPPAVHVAPAHGDGEAEATAMARRAADERRLLEINYAGERDLSGRARLIEPHEVVVDDGRTYIIAWCHSAADWRHFRADRVLQAAMLPDTFEPRPHHTLARPGEVFRAAAHVPVRVRFAPGVARWLRERYPDAEPRPDGGVEVTFPVAEPGWLLRHVLQYGSEAEVMDPPEYRRLLRHLLTR